MPRYLTPLRYPGGKQRFGPYLSEVVGLNRLNGAVYLEPFAGGAGAALHLLFSGAVKRICLNDLDRSIYAFWHSAVHRNGKLRKLIETTPITIGEWDRQKQVQREKNSVTLLELGFSTLFLNRTNRSGVLRAGMIGGRAQAGDLKLSARFNKESILGRLERIAQFSTDIEVECADAVEYVGSRPWGRASKVFLFLDPPYFKKSKDLYINQYRLSDHEALAELLASASMPPWLLTYDNHPLLRRLYAKFPRRIYRLRYVGNHQRDGTEAMIHSIPLQLPPLPSRKWIHEKRSTS